MSRTDFSEKTMACSLALDVCEHWKSGHQRETLTVADFPKIREWIAKSGPEILKYPAMRALAQKGMAGLALRPEHSSGLRAPGKAARKMP